MSFTSRYLRNLWKIRQPAATLEPLAVAYYLTHQCNLNCAYCEDFGISRNPLNPGHQPLERVQAILACIRPACDHLIFTGGEPLLHPQIETILQYAREVLNFRQITLLSNALALQARPNLLDNIDRLLISLDSLDLDSWHTIAGITHLQSQRILDNIQWAAGQQKARRFTLVINCVLTAQTLPAASELLEFCTRHNILLSFSPQSVQNWPDYDLVTSSTYHALIRELLERKKNGAPILGSRAYFETLASLQPYVCHPTLIPRIMPDGALIYPCRPIQRDGGSRGGSAANLLQAGSWQAAVNQSRSLYGPPPETCASCFQQCYAEASLMQERPLEYLWETIRYAPNQRTNLATFAPG